MRIDRAELLSYLGYRGQEINGELESKISKAISICEADVELKSIVKKFKVDRISKQIEGTTLILQGNDIWDHIVNCDYIYIFAATIGFKIEKDIAKEFITDRTLAVILDSAATCAIESYCDDICSKLDSNQTTRYSCGYGDFPIEQQKDICNVLDTFRKIGVFVGPSYMLSPQKSVTAVIGIKNEY